ncbi:MAG: hypothetical protein B7Z78_03070 [Rhodospirillales bacterium 20-60-12]|nr:MAG: hypothetical protein B7Z78_03070 [Rhodospirillales bacterium 20-60-12]HQT66362.1 heme-binding protein [Acetobacteraceae bacterium]
MRFMLVSILMAISMAATARAEPPPSIKIGQLTIETALQMARAALDECRKAGYQVAVTVVDRDGVTQLSERDTLAAPVASTISFEKAYTSAMFEAKGSDLAKFPDRAGLGSANAHLLFSAGSVPIKAGGYFYGAIGVSGTPSGALDEQCAQAGLNAVSDALEMQ